MKPTPAQIWTRFQTYYREFPACGLSMDLSRLGFDDDYLARMSGPMKLAFEAMAALEKGAIANPDEKRQVGHYWLRHAALAPDAATREMIAAALEDIKTFSAAVHEGRIAGQRGAFEHLLVIGIGGSALGPQLVANALGHPIRDRLSVRFFDNTDPDGMDRVLAPIVDQLGKTLVLVISKSGGTPETRNGMLEAEAAYRRAGLDFAKHAVAVTQLDDKSSLHVLARDKGWLKQFPMWDWVGGRTSVTSAVGLLPAALQGLDIDQLLAGAKACDTQTRETKLEANPAALLALAWYHTGGGRGAKDMVVLPYKDRLDLFSKYLQQLIMESLGKELDLDGRIVNQGIAVYGNKGSTDQHAYVQQLREGLHNFFVTFIEVLKDRSGESIEVEPGVTAGDFLHGFLLGTRSALSEKGRESVTLTVPEVNAFVLGSLIALFERTVGLYASLVHINAYHQPGVEAGKKAAAGIIKIKVALVKLLKGSPGQAHDAETLAGLIAPTLPDLVVTAETVFKLSEHLAANSAVTGIRKTAGATPTQARFSFHPPA
ncbi:MAG: glucose-6-phosphate isomerase [Verrucomicrobiales bacterium]|nr:glucose-6-phosphate isomerase [Verrucomicrobiales bacterium]